MQNEWTAKLVGKRMEEAAQTYRLLTEHKAEEYFDAWPGMIYGPTPSQPKVRKPAMTVDGISRLDETLLWMSACRFDAISCKLIWRRAHNTQWKEICDEIGRGRTRAWEMWKEAITQMANYLNGKNEQKTEQTRTSPNIFAFKSS